MSKLRVSPKGLTKRAKPSRLARSSALVVSAPERAVIDLESARDALTRCVSFGSFRALASKIEGARVYLRAINASIESQNKLAEIGLEAQRNMGSVLAKHLVRGKPKVKSPSGISLDELGITAKQSKRWQDLAAVSEAAFRAHVLSVTERSETLTASGVIAAASEAEGYDGDESYTPVEELALVRAVLGTIDLDPATCEAAQAQVQASRFYTKEDNGLVQSWESTALFLNSPYSTALVSQFAARLIMAWSGGINSEMREGIALFNAATDTKWFHDLANVAPCTCLTAGRINFDQVGPDGKLRRTKGNRFAQVFFYFGQRVDIFRAEFSNIGLVGKLEGA